MLKNDRLRSVDPRVDHERPPLALREGWVWWSRLGCTSSSSKSSSSSSSAGDADDSRCSPASTIMIYVHDKVEKFMVGRDITG